MVVKWRGINWMGHIACMGEICNAYGIFIRILCDEVIASRTKVWRYSNMKMDLKKRFWDGMGWICRCQWPRDLRRRSMVACLLRSWVRIPPGAWMFVCCECCVLSEVSAMDWSLVQRSPTNCGTSLYVIKKSHKRGGYSPTRGLQNTNPQWVLAPVEKKFLNVIIKDAL